MQHMEPVEIRDFLQYKFLSSPEYSPDGERAAFIVSNMNESENCYESRLWLWDGERVKQLTDTGKEKYFCWEDGYNILFPASRTEEERKKEDYTSFYRLDIRGGEAIHAFTLPFTAEKLIPLGGGRFAATGDVDVNCPDYYSMSDEERENARKKREEEKDYQVLDEYPFWYNGGGFTNKRRTALFLTDTATGATKRVTEPLTLVGDTAVLNGRVYFISVTYTVRMGLKEDLSVMDSDGTVTTLVKGSETDLYISGIASDGERIWVLASECRDHGINENVSPYVWDEASRQLRLVRHEEYSTGSSVGSDCRHGGGKQVCGCADGLYYTTTREGDSHLYRATPDGGAVPVVTATGSIDSFAVSDRNSGILLVALYGGRLQELYSADKTTGQVRKLTDFNGPNLSDKYVATYNPVSVRSAGYRIDGWVLLPKDYDPAKKYPAVLDIHGGPKTVYGQVFFHEMQVWAGMGYFVFFCNPKGSDGRDNDFMDIRGDYGGTDYRNIMDFTDAVLEQYPAIDRDRVCVTGGSYGGFMTNWIIGHTDRFVCAASQRSISNWLSFWGVSDIGVDFGDDQTAADPYGGAEKMWEQSPLKYAWDVKTPTLFIHSDQDYRCPLPEGIQLYTALVDRGVETRLCLFHGENHELSRSGKPKHRIRRLEEITGWFEKHTKNLK